MLTVVATLAIVASGAWFPAQALADGDPASDVLVGQTLFLPPDAGLSLKQQSELAALLSASAKAGYALRVAVIAGPSDLGSVTPLWRQPANYAEFLGQELSFVYHGTLLVVMPNGYGLYGPRAAVLAGRAGLGQAPAGGLGPGTIAAVKRLAAAAGHPLSVGPVVTRSAPSQTGYAALLALVIGALLIVVAWGASLRARPLRARDALG